MFEGLSLWKLLGQFIEFGLVGVVNTAVSYIIYELMAVKAKVNYILSNFVSYTVGAAISFTLNKIWTFSSKRAVADEAFLFIAVFITCFIMQNGLLILLKEKFHFSKRWAYILATGFYLVVNFLGHRFITFRNA